MCWGAGGLPCLFGYADAATSSVGNESASEPELGREAVPSSRELEMAELGAGRASFGGDADAGAGAGACAGAGVRTGTGGAEAGAGARRRERRRTRHGRRQPAGRKRRAETMHLLHQRSRSNLTGGQRAATEAFAPLMRSVSHLENSTHRSPSESSSDTSALPFVRVQRGENDGDVSEESREGRERIEGGEGRQGGTTSSSNADSSSLRHRKRSSLLVFMLRWWISRPAMIIVSCAAACLNSGGMLWNIYS